MFKRILVSAALIAGVTMECDGARGRIIRSGADVTANNADNTLRYDGIQIGSDFVVNFSHMRTYPKSIEFHNCTLVDGCTFFQLLVGHYPASLTITGYNIPVDDLMAVIRVVRMKNGIFSSNGLGSNFLVIKDFLKREIHGAIGFDTLDLSENGFSPEEKKAILSDFLSLHYRSIRSLLL